MANMDNGHDGAIFSETDVKELSENLSRVFCKFVNTKIGDSHMLKKYIDNYKALLHLPIFLEMQTEIDRLKANLENDENNDDNEDDDNEEHIKLEVEETEIDEGGDVPPYPPLDDEEVEVTEEEEVVEEEVVEEEVEEEEEEVTDDEEEVEEEVTDDEEEVEEEVTDDEEEEGGKGGHLPPEEEEEVEEEVEETDEELEEGGKGGHLPPEEDEEEMYEWEDEESGNMYYTNDPDGESGDIYECLEDDEIGEHIGTITDGKISLF
jgi:hypothetical protein